jgi:hypothetical protein
MPSQIRLYSLVSAHVGPFLDDEGPRETATYTGADGVERPRQQRRKRQRYTGIVISSVQERLWRVKWDQTREESDHTANKLRHVGEGSEAQKAAARVARVEQAPTPTAGVSRAAAVATAAILTPAWLANCAVAANTGLSQAQVPRGGVTRQYKIDIPFHFI